MKNPFGTPFGGFCPELKSIFIAGPQPDLGANDQKFEDVTQYEKENDSDKQSV